MKIFNAIDKRLEGRGNNKEAQGIMQLAKDEADLIFDFESALTDKIIRDFELERSSGQSFSDWLKSKKKRKQEHPIITIFQPLNYSSKPASQNPAKMPNA